MRGEELEGFVRLYRFVGGGGGAQEEEAETDNKGDEKENFVGFDR